MAFNLLGLAVPLYTMQIYDRVLTGGSRETLLYLVLVTVAALAAAVALDVLRSEVAVRIGGWFERQLAPETFVRAVEARMQRARLRGRGAAAISRGCAPSPRVRSRSPSATRSGPRSTSRSCSCCIRGWGWWPRSASCC